MAKKILIASPFFYPEPISTAKYNTSLTKQLLKRGCEVTAICSHPFYPDWIVSKSKDSLEQVKIIRGGSKIKYPKSSTLRRAILELWFCFFFVKNLLAKRKKYDIVISIVPPSLFSTFVSLLVRKKTKKIAIVHDLQNVYAKNMKGLVSKVLSTIIGTIEKKGFSSNDGLVFLSTTMKDCVEEDYGIDCSSSFISYPFVSISQDEYSIDNLSSHFNKERFNIVYSGALGEKQNPYVLLDFFSRFLKTNDSVSFMVFSGGPIFDELKAKYAMVEGIEFNDLVPEQDIFSLYRQSDLQIIPQIDGSNEGSLPSKLPNILISGTPLLAICEAEGELDNILSQLDHSYTINNWDYKAFEDQIKSIMEAKSPASHGKIAKSRIESGLMKKFEIVELIDYILK